MSPENREARAKLEAFFRDSLAAAEADGPSSDDVAAYVDGRLDAEDRTAFEERLADDSVLRDEVADLRALRDALQHEARASRRRIAWAGLAAAAGLAAILVWRQLPPGAARGGTTSTLSPPRLLTLRDAGRDVALRADGSVEGVPSVPAEARVAIVAALRDGALPQPAALAQLRGTRGTLMGEGPVSAFQVAAPVATFVRSDRPTLRWTPHPRAQRYEVVVFSEELVEIASLRTSGAPEATLSTPLERGRTYLWQVAAITPDGRVVAPLPPAPEARFHVLATAESAALESALAAAGDSDLVAGVLLARAGVRDEAETRLARLAAANPGAAAARRLLEAVRQ